MSDAPAATAAIRTAVIGAGWAGMACAVQATRAGHAVTVWEAARAWGGRARSLPVRMPDGSAAVLDNGQHILIGAYRETLGLMQQVGLEPAQLLERLPLALEFPDRSGIRFTAWPAPLDALAGIALARGWSTADKLALVRRALHWQRDRFECAPALSVAQVCHGLPERVMCDLVEPLCVSALNSAPNQSSAQVFLRVLRDALFGERGGSNLLLPRVDLSSLFPDAAARWLAHRGAVLHSGRRVRQFGHDGSRWTVDGASFDQVVLATSAPDALHVLEASLPTLGAPLADPLRRWMAITRPLQHAAIATVYAWGEDATLARPMLALRSGDGAGTPMPAQFVFDRGRLGGPRGLLAFVVSASQGDRDSLQARVLAQAREQLGLALQAVATVVEKRATLVCTPALRRPPMSIATGLLACGDYVDGPYPSTLEGAVRSGMAIIR